MGGDEWAPEKVAPPTRKFRVEFNDSDDLGFVYACCSGAITFDELQQWLHWLIMNQDDLPQYMFDLLDLERVSDFTVSDKRGIGFVPAWDATPLERRAVSGIAFSRFADYRSDRIGRRTALRSLAKSPQIEARFRETFPFIDWQPASPTTPSTPPPDR